MFHRRRAAIAGILACLIASTGALPSSVAARAPEITGFPPRISGLPPRPAVASSPIVVTTLTDVTASDGKCSLREAIAAAVTNLAGPDTTGRCHAGSALETDLITFGLGGAIPLTADLPAIADAVEIDGSTAPSSITVDGAGTYRPFSVDAAGDLTLVDLTVTNGATSATGGAIFNDGVLTLIEVIVSSSHATLAGGGISASSASGTAVIDSVVTGNSTDGSGGGIRSSGIAMIVDSVVSDNMAVAGGGAIQNDGLLMVANATFAGNSASVGGAIRDTGELELYNATLTDNAAPSGSGLASTASPILINDVVLGNTGSDPELVGTLDATSSHNLTSLPGGVSIGQVLDPAGLADNGGTTPTVALVRDAANPAWNGGDQAFCTGFPLVGDQRSYQRSAPCDIGAFEIDDLAPTMAVPAIALRSGARLSGSALAGRVTWSAGDYGSGVAGYELQVNVSGTGFVAVTMDATETELRPALANGKTYQYRARAVDAEGNWSDWKAGPLFTARLLQQAATGTSYSSGWRRDARSAYSGGTARFARAKGAWVKLTATGRVFSFVTTKAPSRGKARVYVDGNHVATIDLQAASTTYRVQAWTKTFATSRKRTIKIVLLGTSGRPRVDADAFAVLR